MSSLPSPSVEFLKKNGFVLGDTGYYRKKLKGYFITVFFGRVFYDVTVYNRGVTVFVVNLEDYGNDWNRVFCEVNRKFAELLKED